MFSPPRQRSLSMISLNMWGCQWLNEPRGSTCHWIFHIFEPGDLSLPTKNVPKRDLDDLGNTC